MIKSKIFEIVVTAGLLVSCGSHLNNSDSTMNESTEQSDIAVSVVTEKGNDIVYRSLVANCLHPSTDGPYSTNEAPKVLNDENTLCIGILTEDKWDEKHAQFDKACVVAINFGHVDSYYVDSYPKVYKREGNKEDYFTKEELLAGKFIASCITKTDGLYRELELFSEMNFLSCDFCMRIENGKYRFHSTSNQYALPIDFFFLSNIYQKRFDFIVSCFFVPENPVNEYERYLVTSSKLEYTWDKYELCWYGDYEPFSSKDPDPRNWYMKPVSFSGQNY